MAGSTALSLCFTTITLSDYRLHVQAPSLRHRLFCQYFLLLGKLSPSTSLRHSCLHLLL